MTDLRAAVSWAESQMLAPEQSSTHTPLPRLSSPCPRWLCLWHGEPGMSLQASEGTTESPRGLCVCVPLLSRLSPSERPPLGWNWQSVTRWQRGSAGTGSAYACGARTCGAALPPCPRPPHRHPIGVEWLYSVSYESAVTNIPRSAGLSQRNSPGAGRCGRHQCQLATCLAIQMWPARHDASSSRPGVGPGLPSHGPRRRRLKDCAAAWERFFLFCCLGAVAR